MDMSFPPVIAGIRDVAERYDGYVLDLWGTVHDGYRPLPGVIDCLERLRARGARIVVVSNAPRRNHAVIARMREIGIADALWDHVLSSGEAANRALLHRDDPWHARLGRRCYHLGPDRDDSVLEDLDIERVDDVAAAEFIVNTGLDKAEETVADYEPVLRAGAEAGVPMICANPDLVVLRGDVTELCAGALAARYEEMGGEVRYHGKPHAPIYETVLGLLGIADRARIVGVGDALRTDVRGATNAGFDSLLVTGGIHAGDLGVREGETPDRRRLLRLYDEIGVSPTAAIPGFAW